MAIELPNCVAGNARLITFVYGLLILLIFALPIIPAQVSGSAYIGIHLAATGLMLWVWAKGALSLKHLLLIGVFLRLALIPMVPFTSNDTERYLWDGAVTLAGLDTYTVSPDHPAAQELRTLWPTPPEHAKYATLYPPGALAMFSISALAGPEMGFWIWKLLVTAASIGSLFLMQTLLKGRSLQRNFPLFALSPLLIMETGIGAHLDGILVFTVLGALVLLQRHRYYSAGAIIGLGATIKFLPIILLGPFLFYLHFTKFIRIGLVVFAIIIAVYAIALSFGLTSLGILPEFIEKWRGGSPLFSILESTLDHNTLMLALGAVFLSLASIAALLARKGYIFEALMVAFSAPLLVSPVVFPWYLSILAALLAFRPSATVLLWITALPLTYETLNLWLSGGIWTPAIWPIYAITLALSTGILIDIFHLTKPGNKGTPTSGGRLNTNGTRSIAVKT